MSVLLDYTTSKISGAPVEISCYTYYTNIHDGNINRLIPVSVSL